MYDYAGITFTEQEELEIDLYMLYLRDAYIFNQMQTEEGREYLENCWILEQTQPDVQALRARFRGE